LIPPAILPLIGYHVAGAAMRKLQFFTIRYVPKIVTGEFVNIGVILSDPSGGFCGVRFLRDWEKVQGLDPDADIKMLEALCGDIEGHFRRGKGAEILKTMGDSFSNTIQLSPGTVCLADEPGKEIAKLASRHLGTSKTLD
jgi:hypothetical protein